MVSVAKEVKNVSPTGTLTYNLGSGYLLKGCVQNGEVVTQNAVYIDNNNNKTIDNLDTRVAASNLEQEIGVPTTQGLNFKPLRDYIDMYRSAKLVIESCHTSGGDYDLRGLFIEMYSTGRLAAIRDSFIMQAIDYLAFQLSPEARHPNCIIKI